ncbi:hypothetical protein BDN70DRAFT_931204 [Pholiota conissans]|uniref:Uncharacterized protein n=1 Tax=Pholiota conissans TaxID=109636 RepID=A0A9P6D2G2_9AGAR|nr:hypothetical protein BDN70DRAFT_931204 [Pholiota conissans]
MHIFRAGLFAIAITIALCTALTSGVPLPIASSLSNKHSTSSVSRTTQLRHHLGSHAPITHDRVQRILTIKKQHASLSESDGVPSPDIVGLERRNAIKKVAQKIGHAFKSAAKKVGHFVKTTGAKIAKVGLKAWSTAQRVASKAAQFIPVVGKPLSKILDGASAATNAASNAIHAKMGGKLGKAMNGMNKARKIAGYVPRELPEDALEERELEELDARYDYVASREVYDDDSMFYARDWNEFGVEEF